MKNISSFMAAALAALVAQGCAGKHCTLVACSDEAKLVLTLPAKSGPLEVEYCLNDSCKTALLSPGLATTCVEIDESDDVVCLATADNGKHALDITTRPPQPSDGDRYSLRVTDTAAGEVLFDAVESAEYEEQRPNGEDCPGTCKTVTIAYES